MPPRPIFDLANSNLFELTIKKSRFLAHAQPLSSPTHFSSLLSSVSDTSASHNCWAYHHVSNSRYNDDGEPSGTAGRPILNAIRASKVRNVLVVVTRYYGGIKLGAGPLARAYFDVAAKCLAEAKKVPVRDMVLVNVKVGWSDVGAVMSLLGPYERLEGKFGENGAEVLVKMEREVVENVVQKVRDVSRGRGDVEVREEGDEESG